MKPQSQHVPVDTSPERMSKIWTRVSFELQSREQEQHELRTRGGFAAMFQTRLVWAGGALAVAAAMLLMFGPWRGGLESMLASAGLGAASAQRLHVGQGSTLETNVEPLSVSMDDGSGLALSPNTRLEIEQAEHAPEANAAEQNAANEGAGRIAEGTDARARVAVRLTKGKVQCDVTPNPKRRFIVQAKGVEVRVTGTSFSVELSPNLDEVRVQVLSGTVEVAPPGSSGHERRLSAGEVWAIDLARANAASSASGLLGAGSSGAGASAREPELAPSGTWVDSETREPEAGNEHGLPKQRRAGPPDTNDNGVEANGEPGAPELFDHANAARRAGDAREAARGYEQLLAKFPSDGRAGLAAFELGRLRMDRLSDLSGAVTALKRAVTLAPGSGFREDAMARLVQAYASLGAADSCRSARDAYLKAYPKGVHLAAVSRKCN